MTHRILIWAAALWLTGNNLEAGVASKVVKEAFEFTTKRFGKEVAEEGVERLSTRMTQLAAKHGDEVVSAAFRKIGPRAGRIASEAGEQADIALRLLAQHGDEAVTVASRASARQLVSQYGDDAATALVRHGTVGEGVVSQFAENGAKALAQITPQNGRRLAMLADDGALSTPLLDVVAKYGDRACQFIWQNKGALAVGATLVTFLAAPEDFMSGTAQLTEVVAEHVVTPVASQVLAPIAQMPQAVAVEMAKGTNWTAIGIVALLLGVLAVAAKSSSWGWARRLATTACKAIQNRWPTRGH
ncbi:MAG: hypothetical protein IAG10_23955 [Planctomycetaceae bacterium]|nr:hypothetical protein [Planctomycetaceae bacterium]